MSRNENSVRQVLDHQIEGIGIVSGGVFRMDQRHPQYLRGGPDVFPDFSPIKRAASGIGQTLITSVASLIVALAAVVPWLPVIVFVVWVVLWSFGRWRTHRAVGEKAT